MIGSQWSSHIGLKQHIYLISVIGFCNNRPILTYSLKAVEQKWGHMSIMVDEEKNSLTAIGVPVFSRNATYMPPAGALPSKWFDLSLITCWLLIGQQSANPVHVESLRWRGPLCMT